MLFLSLFSRLSLRYLSGLLLISMLVVGCGDGSVSKQSQAANAPTKAKEAQPDKPNPPVPAPIPEAGQIGMLVGKIMSQEHYLRQPLNDAVSKQFLKFYLDDLDYNRLIFLQSDIQAFESYAATLDNETLQANVQPGYDMFARYLRRVEERVAWVKEILKEPVTFDKDEEFVMDRHELSWPKDEQEAKSILRQRIKFELLQEKLNKKKSKEMVETVSKRWDSFLRNVREEDSESILQRYLTALSHAYDPHSDYMSPSEWDNFKINMKLSLVGIGAMLRSEDGYPKVIAIVPGGPADLDKRLKVNDRIAAVAQGEGPMVDVVDIKLNKAVAMIRGEKNTVVRLRVIPGDAPDPSTRVDIKLVRDEIKLKDAEAKARIYERKEPSNRTFKIGYIDLPSFYSELQGGPNAKSTTRDVRMLVDRLKKENTDGLVIDLRRNGGGSLPEVIQLTGLFIKDGPVLQVKNSRGHVEVLSDDDTSVLFDKPIVIMVSHVSASASEILAAALQDYRRAVIVGDKNTFGKGTVQKLEELDRYLSGSNSEKSVAGALKFTTQKFYRISGGSTQYKGVVPDIQLPSQLDYLKINEAALKNALPYDEVAPAVYEAERNTPWNVEKLIKKSQERVTKDPEFKYVMEDIERLKPQLEQKTVSLNEAKRLEEKKANLERTQKRNTERQTRKNPVAEFYEIKLESDGNTKVAELTKKVIEEANANSAEANDETPVDTSIDPELNEGLNVLCDMISEAEASAALVK